MTRLARLLHADELLDAPVHDPAELAAALDDIAAVNRRLGGRRALLRHLAPLLPAGRPARILDVGTGSGDLPRAIVDWARRRGRQVSIVATDIHPQVLDLARRRLANRPEIDFELADTRDLPFPDRAFDVAILTLTLHHLRGEDEVRALRELQRVSGRGILVGELERCWPNYLGARLLAVSLWRGSRLTRHDGPISVLRAYTPGELLELAHRAALPAPHVARHPFYRLILRTRRDEAQPVGPYPDPAGGGGSTNSPQ